MTNFELRARALTRESFAPFGDVIEIEGADHFGINDGRIERFHDLASVDVGVQDGGRPLISIALSNWAVELPFEIELVERHPLGSQAFIPLDDTPLVVVVAPPGEAVDPDELGAFVSNGKQGVNYRPGVWHLPLISLKKGQRCIILDRGGSGQNCDELRFPEHRITVSAPASMVRANDG